MLPWVHFHLLKFHNFQFGVSGYYIFNIGSSDFTEKDHNKHFLLIDDVITTGSTLEACSRALLKIPGARISIVCMAMSHS